MITHLLPTCQLMWKSTNIVKCIIMSYVYNKNIKSKKKEFEPKEISLKLVPMTTRFDLVVRKFQS